jgi:hypothetical protein
MAEFFFDLFVEFVGGCFEWTLEEVAANKLAGKRDKSSKGLGTV